MTTTQRFHIPFLLPAFNELEAAARRTTRGKSNAYAELKYATQANIVAVINRTQPKLRPLLPGVSIAFTWFERDRRRDPLDVRPACKFIVDALCGADRDGDRQPRAGILHCDGWHCINPGGIHDAFAVTPGAVGVTVALYGTVRP